MSFFLSNDSPVLDCHFHLKISHFMTPYFMCISGIANDRNYDCHLSSAISPLSRSLHSMLRNPTSLFFPAACSSQAAYFGSLPASTLALRRASPSGSSTAPTPRVCKTHVFYSPTHGNYLLWFQKPVQALPPRDASRPCAMSSLSFALRLV